MDPRPLTPAADAARVERGAPVVATAPRWAAAVVAVGALVLGGAQAYRVVSHSPEPLGAFAWPIAVGVIAGAALVWALLRGEELRLMRELRTARTGTPALRALAARRRRRASPLAGLVSTRLGMAAVLLADGERAEALDVLGRASPLMRGGRLEQLHEIVSADLERATGAPASLDRAAVRLLAMERVGNREADLYRTHVLARTLLERGDVEKAREAAGRLAAAVDDEERVYHVWLRTWFDLDAEGADGEGSWPAPSEGELRVAALLARAHGADKLVERLEAQADRGVAQPAERK